MGIDWAMSSNCAELIMSKESLDDLRLNLIIRGRVLFFLFCRMCVVVFSFYFFDYYSINENEDNRNRYPY